jgi:hypothetical protein
MLKLIFHSVVLGTAVVATASLRQASPTTAFPRLAILPTANGQSASYVVDFSADYGGYHEGYRASLRLRQTSNDALVLDGTNERSKMGALSQSEAPHSMARVQAVTARRSGPSRSVVVSGTQLGIADQVFDYDSLLTLLPAHPPRGAGVSWRASTRCWASNTVSAAIPVIVYVDGSAARATLRATGRKRLAIGSARNPIFADFTVSIAAVFRNGALSYGVEHVHEIFERRGLPSGGGTYSWTIRLKGTAS